MAVSSGGTFEYRAIVPEGRQRERPWDVALHTVPADSRGPIDDGLVGHAPALEIGDAGLTPDVRVSPFTGTVRPKVLLSRVALRAPGGALATRQSFSFCVDRALTATLRPGDHFFIRRTASADLGVSVIRNGELVVAAGAIEGMPLGENTFAGCPHALVRESEQVFQRIHPGFEFRELPVEVRIGSDTGLYFRARRRMGRYDVSVEHGAYPGIPGTSACVAISCHGVCPDGAAISSAQLLEYGDLQGIGAW